MIFDTAVANRLGCVFARFFWDKISNLVRKLFLVNFKFFAVFC